MQIQFTVIGDNIDEIAAELRLIADRLQGTAAEDKAPEPAPEPAKEKPPAKKAKAAEKPKDPEPAPEPEVEAAPEPAPEQVEQADPEKDWAVACDMLMKLWTDSPGRKEDILDVVRSFGVQKFSEVPKEKGTELLEKARAL